MLSRLLPLGMLTLFAACAAPPPPPVAEVPAPVMAPPPAPPPVAARTGRERFVRAKVCEIGRTGRYSADAGTISPMTVSNEGGWCYHSFSQEHRAPFTGGNIITAAEHGEARVRNVGRRTRLEYRPSPGYVGTDRFTATLTPGNGTYIVEVTVRP